MATVPVPECEIQKTFGDAFDQEKVLGHHQGDDEQDPEYHHQPYRHLKRWCLYETCSTKKKKKSSKGGENTKIKYCPIPYVKCSFPREKYVLEGWLQPANNNKRGSCQVPCFVRLTELDYWAFDQSKASRGFWVLSGRADEDREAWYWLQEPDRQQEPHHLWWRASLAVYSNLLDFVLQPERLYTCYGQVAYDEHLREIGGKAIEELHEQITAERGGDEPFDLRLLGQTTEFCRSRLVQLGENIFSPSSTFVQSLRYLPRFGSLAKVEQQIMNAVIKAEERSEQYQWGQPKSGWGARLKYIWPQSTQASEAPWETVHDDELERELQSDDECDRVACDGHHHRHPQAKESVCQLQKDERISSNAPNPEDPYVKSPHRVLVRSQTHEHQGEYKNDKASHRDDQPQTQPHRSGQTKARSAGSGLQDPAKLCRRERNQQGLNAEFENSQHSTNGTPQTGQLATTGDISVDDHGSRRLSKRTASETARQRIAILGEGCSRQVADGKRQKTHPTRQGCEVPCGSDSDPSHHFNDLQAARRKRQETHSSRSEGEDRCDGGFDLSSHQSVSGGIPKKPAVASRTVHCVPVELIKAKLTAKSRRNILESLKMLESMLEPPPSYKDHISWDTAYGSHVISNVQYAVELFQNVARVPKRDITKSVEWQLLFVNALSLTCRKCSEKSKSIMEELFEKKAAKFIFDTWPTAAAKRLADTKGSTTLNPSLTELHILIAIITFLNNCPYLIPKTVRKIQKRYDVDLIRFLNEAYELCARFQSHALTEACERAKIRYPGSTQSEDWQLAVTNTAKMITKKTFPAAERIEMIQIDESKTPKKLQARGVTKPVATARQCTGYKVLVPAPPITKPAGARLSLDVRAEDTSTGTSSSAGKRASNNPFPSNATESAVSACRTDVSQGVTTERTTRAEADTIAKEPLSSNQGDGHREKMKLLCAELAQAKAQLAAKDAQIVVLMRGRSPDENRD